MGEDFYLNGTNQTFYYESSTEVCFELRIIDDLFIENTESFTISVLLSNSYDSIYGNNSTEIFIEDNDGELYVAK